MSSRMRRASPAGSGRGGSPAAVARRFAASTLSATTRLTRSTSAGSGSVSASASSNWRSSSRTSSRTTRSRASEPLEGRRRNGHQLLSAGAACRCLARRGRGRPLERDPSLRIRRAASERNSRAARPPCRGHGKLPLYSRSGPHGGPPGSRQRRAHPGRARPRFRCTDHASRGGSERSRSRSASTPSPSCRWRRQARAFQSETRSPRVTRSTVALLRSSRIGRWRRAFRR